MFRREIAGKSIVYDESFREAQDQRLWIYMAARSRLGSICAPLVVALRNDPDSITARRTLTAEIRLKWRLITAAHVELDGNQSTALVVKVKMIKQAVINRLRVLVRSMFVTLLGEATFKSVLSKLRRNVSPSLSWKEIDALWRQH